VNFNLRKKFRKNLSSDLIKKLKINVDYEAKKKLSKREFLVTLAISNKTNF
jgi:hypothetical protein